MTSAEGNRTFTVNVCVGEWSQIHWWLTQEALGMRVSIHPITASQSHFSIIQRLLISQQWVEPPNEMIQVSQSRRREEDFWQLCPPIVLENSREGVRGWNTCRIVRESCCENVLGKVCASGFVRAQSCVFYIRDKHCKCCPVKLFDSRPAYTHPALVLI